MADSNAIRTPAKRQTAPVVSIDSGGHRERIVSRRDALVTDHLGLVDQIARTVHKRLPPSFDIDDLIGAGRVGLIAAATRYRPNDYDAAPFSAYARLVIRGAMLDTVKRRAYADSTMLPLTGGEEIPEVAPDYDCVIDSGRLRRRLKEATAQLPAPERRVLRAFYGPKEPSMAAVAKKLRIPERRAYEIHRRAVDGLRELMREAG